MIADADVKAPERDREPNGDVGDPGLVLALECAAKHAIPG